MTWKTVTLFPLYDVSDAGEVRSRARTATGRPKPIKPTKNADGYLEVTLSNNGKRQFFRIHRLVWMTFRATIPDGKEINHIDGARSRNSLDNLEVVSRSENMRHSWDIIGKRSHKGERHPRAKLNDAAVRDIRQRRLAGETLSTIAADYNTSPTQISFVARGVTWSHIS